MSTGQKQRVTHPPLPDGRPETWVYLADWPMPEGGKLAVERECKEYPFRGKALAYLEDGIKLTYLFGGLSVATKRTDRGLTVLNAEDSTSGDGLYAWLFSLPPEEPSDVLVHYVEDP